MYSRALIYRGKIIENNLPKKLEKHILPSSPIVLEFQMCTKAYRTGITPVDESLHKFLQGSIPEDVGWWMGGPGSEAPRKPLTF